MKQHETTARHLKQITSAKTKNDADSVVDWDVARIVKVQLHNDNTDTNNGST